MRSKTLSSGRVLVVDDDRAIRDMICLILKRADISCAVVNDGQAAIEQLVEHSFELLILDLMLPRFTGYNVLQFLRDHPVARRPKIFILTANSDEFRRRMQDTSVDALIQKPFDPQELLERIQAALASADQPYPGGLPSEPDR